MDIIIIRHGKTQGNVERRYIGTTDEPLCARGETELAGLVQSGVYPGVEYVFTSPLQRCRRTCELVFPGLPSTVVEGLREQAFGVFENKSYEELQFLPAYRAWLETAGGADIPQGESSGIFHARCRAAFSECVADGLAKGAKSIAIVAHGGVLMAALSAFAQPAREFYAWQVENGRGFLLHTDGEIWARESIVRLVKEIGREAAL